MHKAIPDYDVIGFDVDSTLVEPWTRNLYPALPDWLRVTPLNHIYLATNQAGPYYRELTGKDKYPTVNHVINRLFGIVARIEAFGHRTSATVPLLVSFHPHPNDKPDPEICQRVTNAISRELATRKKNGDYIARLEFDTSPKMQWRKPSPLMLQRGATLCPTTYHSALFIGDSDADLGAAEGSAHDFLHATAFHALLRG